jgi:hypothetical protein
MHPAETASVAAAAPNDEAVLREMAQAHGIEEPVDCLIALRNERYPQSRPRYWGVVDFGLHSAKPRLFVLDVKAATATAYLCAHGRGSEGASDDGYANIFSNVPGSEATSLGIYRCAETYQGANGYSLKLDGLEATNSNARDRYIVMHGATYVSKEFAREHGRIGRSEGCPAVDHDYAETIIDQLKEGSFLIHWRS